MPTIKLRLSNGEPLLIPAASFRLAEGYDASAENAVEGANAILMYDINDAGGIRTVVLKSTVANVVEQVKHDPAFYGRILECTEIGSKPLAFLAQHVVAVAGIVPLSDVQKETMAKGDAQAVAAVQMDAALLEAGARTQLDLSIPDRNGEHPYTFWLTDPAEELINALDPPTEEEAVKPASRKRSTSIN